MHALHASPPPPPATFPPTDWPNRFQALGPGFYTPVPAQELPDPHWVAVSEDCARHLGWPADWWQQAGALAVFSGNRTWPGMTPLAAVYSGHQFGVWAGQLGDGRALLLGETEGGLELQLKGAGRTPYSRMGDGRAVLRSSIREFLCSEAMHGLGIPTTRALCVTGSDAPVRREEIETAAVVTRVAPSFIRFGHFEHFAANDQLDELRRLADFVIDSFYPAARHSERLAGNPYAALLEAVSERTATLLAQWQAVGFCHGVMNTDNMSILGLTLDYGPFQFLDSYDPAHICNHSDTQGRYAYARQPNIAYWNLFCLGQALLPLIGDQELALAALESYKSVFPAALEARLRAKLGLRQTESDDRGLIEGALRLLATERVDYTIFWRRLCDYTADGQAAPVRDLFLDRAGFDAWLRQYEARLAREDAAAAAATMRQANPKFVLRNHLGELAIRQARQKDFSGVAKLLALLEHPYDEHPGHEAEAGFPPDWAASIAISCSS
jgi:uncharacterized protein YdiU (UPF0061 family)